MPGPGIGWFARAVWTLLVRGYRLIAKLRPAARGVVVDLDPPTVEILLPIAAGTAHTNGDAQWQRPGPVTEGGTGRPDVPVGQAWWNP